MNRKLIRRESLVVCCTYCGTFIQKIQGESKCNMVCYGCGRNIAIVVKKGKVTIFEEKHDDSKPEHKDRIHLLGYTNGINMPEHEHRKIVAKPEAYYISSASDTI